MNFNKYLTNYISILKSKLNLSNDVVNMFPLFRHCLVFFSIVMNVIPLIPSLQSLPVQPF